MTASASPVAIATKARARRDKDAAKRRKPYDDMVEMAERVAHRGRAPIATGQTIIKSRLSEAPLARLKRTRALCVHELTAADEIIFAYQVSTGQGGVVRDSDLGIPATIRSDGADAAATRRIDNIVAYQQWRRELTNTPALAAAVALLLDERPMRETERANQWRNGTAFSHLVTALRHFAALRGNTPRGARGWRVVPMHGTLEQAMRTARLVPRGKRRAA